MYLAWIKRAMVDLIEEVEARRQALRLSQEKVAAEIGFSQGHYSKVTKGGVPMTPKMAAKMTNWLADEGALGKGSAEEILEKCMELMHLLRRYIDADATAVTKQK